MEQTFFEHIESLRRLVIAFVIILVVALSSTFYFSDNLVNFLTSSLHENENNSLQRLEIKKNRLINTSSISKTFSISESEVSFTSPGTLKISKDHFLIPPQGYVDVEKTFISKKLVLLSPMEGFLATLKISFWVGLILSSPFWIGLALKFILPGLYPYEKKLIAPFLVLSALFISLGLSFGYYISIPFANQYLQNFNEGLGINLWTVSHYLDYVLTILLANAFSFELVAVLLLLVHKQMIALSSLTTCRRHMIVLSFVLGAIFTPPDVFTQILFAAPMIALYELIIIYAKIRERVLKKRLSGDEISFIPN